MTTELSGVVGNIGVNTAYIHPKRFWDMQKEILSSSVALTEQENTI